MGKRIIFFLALLLIFSYNLSAQTVSKTFNITTKDFSKVEGTPRIVRNGFDHEWVVAWRQQGSPSKIFARIIESDGVLRKRKILATKVGSAPQSFDIFFDSINYNYLLVFENAGGLQFQRLTNVLAKIGTPKLIEAGVSGTIPRLSFDPVAKRFLVFWIGDNGTSLKSVLVDATGNAGTIRTLAHASGNTQFKSLNISTNQDTGILMALVTVSDGASGKLLGYRIKPDGTLQKAKAISLSPSDPHLNSIFADSSFSDAGSGFAFWSDDEAIKRRKISRTGGIASAAKSIDNEADDNSTQTSILFDSRNNQFIGAWAVDNHIRAMALDTAGNVKNNPFDVATSAFSDSRNPATSYDGQSGNAIVVWEDSTEDVGSSSTNVKFRIRGAIFFFQSTAAPRSISIGDNFFNAGGGNGNLTIQAGDTVTWTNNGSVTHTATSGTESNAGSVFDSGNLSRGQTFSFRFNTAGTFPYFCRIHGSNTMNGTITVTSGGGEPPPRY